MAERPPLPHPRHSAPSPVISTGAPALGPGRSSLPLRLRSGQALSEVEGEKPGGRSVDAAGSCVRPAPVPGRISPLAPLGRNDGEGVAPGRNDGVGVAPGRDDAKGVAPGRDDAKGVRPAGVKGGVRGPDRAQIRQAPPGRSFKNISFFSIIFLDAAGSAPYIGAVNARNAPAAAGRRPIRRLSAPLPARHSVLRDGAPVRPEFRKISCRNCFCARPDSIFPTIPKG